MGDDKVDSPDIAGILSAISAVLPAVSSMMGLFSTGLLPVETEPKPSPAKKRLPVNPIKRMRRKFRIE